MSGCLPSRLHARTSLVVAMVTFLADAAEEGDVLLIFFSPFPFLCRCFYWVDYSCPRVFLGGSFGGAGICPGECLLPFGLGDTACAWTSSLGGSCLNLVHKVWHYWQRRVQASVLQWLSTGSKSLLQMRRDPLLLGLDSTLETWRTSAGK